MNITMTFRPLVEELEKAAKKTRPRKHTFERMTKIDPEAATEERKQQKAITKI